MVYFSEREEFSLRTKSRLGNSSIDMQAGREGGHSPLSSVHMRAVTGQGHYASGGGMKKWKGFERNRPYLKTDTILAVDLSDWQKPRYISNRTDSVLV